MVNQYNEIKKKHFQRPIPGAKSEKPYIVKKYIKLVLAPWQNLFYSNSILMK